MAFNRTTGHHWLDKKSLIYVLILGLLFIRWSVGVFQSLNKTLTSTSFRISQRSITITNANHWWSTVGEWKHCFPWNEHVSNLDLFFLIPVNHTELHNLQITKSLVTTQDNNGKINLWRFQQYTTTTSNTIATNQWLTTDVLGLKNTKEMKERTGSNF